MSSLSPAAVLYDGYGVAIAVQNGVATPSSTSGLMVSGSDGTNSRFFTVDTSGRLVAVGAGTAGSPVGGVVTIQGISGGTVVPVSGTVTSTIASVGLTGATAPTSADLSGAVVQALQSGLTLGDLYPLSMTQTGLLRVDGSNVTQPVSGTVAATQSGSWTTTVTQATAANLNATVVGSGNFTVVQSTAASLNATVVGTTAAGSGASSGLVTIQGNASVTPVPVSGTVTATNASVGTDGSTALTSDTQVGGKVTTSAPTYTTGNLNALSLTTAGLLRIDGVYPLNATTPTSDITFIGAAVTTSAPSYTTGQLSALSLDTSGNLRTTTITDKSSTGTITSVAISTSSVTVLAANANRVSATIVNDSIASVLYIALAATATTSAYTTKLLAGDYWELPIAYTGAISAIANLAQGSMRITELTP